MERWGYRVWLTDEGRRWVGCDALAPASVRGSRSDDVRKRSRTSTIWSFRVEGGDGGAVDVYYKTDNSRGVLDVLKNAMRASRSLRAWRSFERLERMGFDVPRRLLCGERRLGPLLLDSFLVTEAVEDAPSIAGLIAPERSAPGREGSELGPRPRRRLIELLAGLVRRLHAGGVYHADLAPTNVLLRPEDGALVLLDADRTVFGTRVPRRKRLKNIAQLNAAFDGVATLADRVRFYRLYDPAHRERSRSQRRALLAEIETLTDRRWR